MKGLTGLRIRKRNVERLGCIKGCLEYLGSGVSFSWLYGGTGHAFTISLDPGVDVSSPDSWDHRPQYELGANLGYRVDGFAVSKPEAGDAFPARQREAWDFIRAHLDRGVPCFGFELIDEWDYPRTPDFDSFWRFLNGLADLPEDKCCRTGGCGAPNCAIRACARSRGIEVCPLCADYPCSKIHTFAQSEPLLLHDGERIKKVGLEQWIEDGCTHPRRSRAVRPGLTMAACAACRALSQRSRARLRTVRPVTFATA